MNLLKILAFPVSLLYGSIIFLRNKLYDTGLLKSVKFNLPVISIGNLSTGGTGKTPHIEYLIRLLKGKYTIATLSRGYGRSSFGFLIATETSDTSQIGDEPRQFKNKFNDVIVAVDANRVRAVRKLLKQFPHIQTVLLDDAYQHRAITPGISILLTDYNDMYYHDYILPTGSLREFRSGVKRADIIIVTKSPEILSPIEKRRIMKKINPETYQKVYFSYVHYGNFLPLGSKNHKALVSKEFYFERNYSIVLFTGIANGTYLEYYLKSKIENLVVMRFADHHEYTADELIQVRKKWDSIKSENKIILTTEKDAMRLAKESLIEVFKNIPLFYIPIEILFHDKEEERFHQQIFDYLRKSFIV